MLLSPTPKIRWPGTTFWSGPTLQIHMLQFVCDSCEAVKAPAETWINGVAAESVGARAAHREVVIDPAWRRERAVLPFAVHFCSVECKDRYLAELFRRPAALLEVEHVDAEPGRRVVRATKRPVKGAGPRRAGSIQKSRTRVGKPKPQG